MPEELTLLIDADVVAFTAASAAQHIYEDSFGYVQPFANKVEGEAIVDNMVLGLELAFKCSHMRFILSDPKANWRNDVWPAYKSNRKDGIRPLLLDYLKQYMRDKYQAEHWAELEADDVLGILNTEPQEYSGKRILVGRDKDFKTIPGLYHRLKDFDVKGNPVVQEITEWEATRFHMYQTLKGDMTDGYPGCPGIGDKRAEELLDNPVLLRATEGVVTRGPRKGESTQRWVSEPTKDYWAMIVSHYRKGGQGEEEALVTARLANILRHDQYDRETGEITLWTPDRLRGL
jgi:DNA polymerase-1